MKALSSCCTGFTVRESYLGQSGLVTSKRTGEGEREREREREYHNSVRCVVSLNCNCIRTYDLALGDTLARFLSTRAAVSLTAFVRALSSSLWGKHITLANIHLQQPCLQAIKIIHLTLYNAVLFSITHVGSA